MTETRSGLIRAIFWPVSVAALVAATVVVAPSAAQATDYHKCVIASDVSLFPGADSQVVKGHFYQGQDFYVDRTDPPYNRYHISSGPDWGWVTSDSRYVTAC